jgi:hypothetical protein
MTGLLNGRWTAETMRNTARDLNGRAEAASSMHTISFYIVTAVPSPLIGQELNSNIGDPA